MKVLEGTKLILRYLDLYTRPSVDIAGLKIPSQFIEYFVSLSIIVTLIPIAVFCYVNVDNFKTSSSGILYFMANSSINIVYLVLLLQRKRIINSIDEMEKLIKSRNTHIVNFYRKIIKHKI